MTISDGFVIVDKPQGVTSHDVVNQLRKFFNTKAVGHGGTLDPMATGVLVLGINKATKLLTFCLGDDKAYRATIRLGAATNTDDAMGEIIKQINAAQITELAVEQALAQFMGEIAQVPSQFSAKKIKGKKAYQFARKGETVELAPKKVSIKKLEKISFSQIAEYVDVEVLVECSSGTYIRALARDLGELLKVGGHLIQLRRLACGRFSEKDCTELSSPKLIAITQIAQMLFSTVSITAEQAKDLQMGRKVTLATKIPQLQAAIDQANQLIALVEKSEDKIAPKLVFGV